MCGRPLLERMDVPIEPPWGDRVYGCERFDKPFCARCVARQTGVRMVRIRQRDSCMRYVSFSRGDKMRFRQASSDVYHAW